jgi:hypothetical protein
MEKKSRTHPCLPRKSNTGLTAKALSQAGPVPLSTRLPRSLNANCQTCREGELLNTFLGWKYLNEIDVLRSSPSI